MQKKGDGQVFWIIVMGILAIVVLFVLISVFTSKIGGVNKQTDSCLFKGGSCVSGTNGACSGNAQRIEGADCTSPQICCVKV